MGKISEQFAKKKYGWKSSIWKDTQHHLSLLKCKIKQQEILLHLKNGWNPKKYWQYQLLVRLKNSHHSHLLIVGIQTCTITLENNLEVSDNFFSLNIILTYNLSVVLLYLPRFENIYPGCTCL